MKEWMVELLYPWGIVCKFHVDGDDRVEALGSAIRKAMNIPGARPAYSWELKTISIMEWESSEKNGTKP